MVSFSIKALVLALGLVAPAVADVQLDSMESSYSASSTMKITWTDDGSDPSLDDLTSANILLCTGPNDDIHCFDDAYVAKGIDPSAKKYSADLSTVSSLGDDGNYYLQFVSEYKGGGQTLHYSDRFKLTGMTGSYKATGSGDPPTGENDANLPSPSSLISVTYTLQTGPTRMAPMQLQPGTSVDLSKSWSRLFPTSAVTYFTTYGSAAKFKTTLTPGWSYTVHTSTNGAATRPWPTVYYSAAKPAMSNFTIAHSAFKTMSS
uniref:ARAD1B06050p n=1 Tax=Blastobotrys adeninivorans TaxID=409370 RepID=A0A060T5B8_BLAAD